MQPSKLALLSVAVSSAMVLSACGSGSSVGGKAQNKIAPTQNIIQASVEQYVKQMTNEQVKQIQSVNVEDQNTVVLTTDTKLFDSYSVGDIVALPPSDNLLIGYTGKIESKTNQAGTTVVKMRMATIPEVFKKLDFTFNSANPDTKVVGVITPPNATGTVNLSRQNASNTSLQTGLTFGAELKQEDGKFGGEINLEYAIKDDIKMKIIGSISDLQVIEELKYYPDERQCTELTRQGSTMDSCKSNHILATDYKVVSSEVMGKINVKVEFEGGQSINNPIKIQDVWKDLSKGKKYLNLTGLDESDKQGLIPLAGIVLNGTVTGFVGEPLDSIKKITQAGGAIVWLYLNRQGEIVSYKGTITPINLEKSFYQKTTLIPDAKKNELVGTPSIDRNSNTSLKSAIKGSIEMNQTLGVTLAADLFIGGIRPFTAQLSPLLSNLNVKLNGDYTYDWLLGKPTGQYGCINATNKIFGNVLVKAGLGVKVGNWKSIGGIYQYSNDWIYKEDKLLNSCYTAGKPDFTVTNKGDDPKNPNNVLYEIDITNAFSGMEGILNEMGDNVDWSLQVNAPKRIFSDYGTYNPKSKKFTSTQYDPQIISPKLVASLPKGVEATFHFETNAQDFSGKPVVTQKKLLVKSQPNVTAISPLSASINEPVTFKVTGSGLPKTAILAIDDAICEQPKNHTATGFEQVCTLKGNNPNRKVTIKTDTQANKGVVINDKLSITLGYPIRPVKMTATGITLCSNDINSKIVCSLLDNNWRGLLQDGEVQAGQPMSYELRQYNNETCVIDKVTGLTWEQKTDDGRLRDKDNTYTWYNPDNKNNGGYAGFENNGKNTHEYIKQLNANNYCGYNNWRLPTKDELYSIVDYGRYEPAINTDKFPNTQSKDYWSSYSHAESNHYAWIVHFGLGHDQPSWKNNSHYVRAVRSN